jgi:hypothetical protein
VYGFVDAGGLRRKRRDAEREVSAHAGFGAGLRADVGTGALDLAFGAGDGFGDLKVHVGLQQRFCPPTPNVVATSIVEHGDFPGNFSAAGVEPHDVDAADGAAAGGREAVPIAKVLARCGWSMVERSDSTPAHVEHFEPHVGDAIEYRIESGRPLPGSDDARSETVAVEPTRM